MSPPAMIAVTVSRAAGRRRRRRFRGDYCAKLASSPTALGRKTGVLARWRSLSKGMQSLEEIEILRVPKLRAVIACDALAVDSGST